MSTNRSISSRSSKNSSPPLLIGKWKRVILAGCGIFVIALILRLVNLTYLPVFGDEAIYIRWAQVMRTEPTLRFLPLSDGKQPLFMWSVIPLLKIFSNPLVAGRIVSVITGLTTTVGVFMLSVLLFGDRGGKPSHSGDLDKSKSDSTLSSESILGKILKHVQYDRNAVQIGLIAALIYAISPFTVFFDRMALVDSMLTMFGVWTLIFTYFSVKYLRFDFAMLAGFTLGGALLTKSPGIFFWLLIPTLWLFADWPKTKKLINKGRAIHLIKLLFLFATTSTISLGMFNVLRLGPNFHMLSIRTKDYVYPVSHLLQRPLDPLIPFLKNNFEYFWLLGPSLVVVFFVIALLFNTKKHLKQYALLIAWGLIPVFVVSEFSKTMTARYVLFTIPYFFVLAASVFMIKKELFKKVLAFGIIIFIIQSLQIDNLLLNDLEAAPLPLSERSGYLEEWTAGTGIYEVSEIIRGEYLSAPDEKIVVGTEGFFGTLPDGLQIYLNDLPEITVIGVGSNMTDLPNSLIESKQAGNKTYLVINDSRLIAEPGDLGLLLLAVYPKAFRTEGTMEYVNKGPRETLYLFEVTKRSITPKEEAGAL